MVGLNNMPKFKVGDIIKVNIDNATPIEIAKVIKRKNGDHYQMLYNNGFVTIWPTNLIDQLCYKINKKKKSGFSKIL